MAAPAPAPPPRGTMDYSSFKDAERSGWNERAAVYESHTALATLQIAPAMLDALRLRPGMRLLDVACGTGNVAAAASALGCEACGIDFAPAMIAQAKARFPGTVFQEGDAEALDFDEASFDAVSNNMGLFHVSDTALALSEARRVLVPGGRFSFSQWAAPEESDLYRMLFSIIPRVADMTRADPAPDAYALSDPAAAQGMLRNAGFDAVETRRLDTVLLANGPDFFEFFLNFGVRVPLIVQAQDPDVQDQLRREINAAVQPYRTPQGYEVPMPSLLYTGQKPC